MAFPFVLRRRETLRILARGSFPPAPTRRRGPPTSAYRRVLRVANRTADYCGPTIVAGSALFAGAVTVIS